MSIPIETRRFPVAPGLSVAADVGGPADAPAVMLCHGGGQTRHSWGSAMTELLAAGYRVINLDARGHGDSDWSPDGDYRLETMAADQRAVAATLPAPPAIVGASMGGASGLLAASTPGTARALVLVDIVPQLNSGGSTKIRAFMRARPEGFATLDDAADAVAAYYPNRPRPKDPSGLLKNLRRRDDGRLHWHWDPAFVRCAFQAEPPQFESLLYPAAQTLRIPTLLVRGLQSDIVDDDGVAALRRHLPGLDVCDVAGAGHMVAGDRNDVFNRGVIGFLQRHLPVRG